MQADRMEKVLDELEEVCKKMNQFLNKANALFEETLRANPDMEMRWKMATEYLPESLACKLPERKGFIAVKNSEDGYAYCYYSEKYIEEETGKMIVNEPDDIKNIYEMMEMLVLRKGCYVAQIVWMSFYELREQVEKQKQRTKETASQNVKVIPVLENKVLNNGR